MTRRANSKIVCIYICNKREDISNIKTQNKNFIAYKTEYDFVLYFGSIITKFSFSK